VTAVSAHRGGGEVFAPQTYESYELAASSGVQYVEFDVRRLADGALVCFHDADISGAHLATLRYPDLCARAGYEVVVLSRLMELIAGRTCGHIDLKETGYEEQVVAQAREVLGPAGFLVTSMVDGSLRRIAQAFPGTPTGLSLGRGIGDVPSYQLPGAIVGDLFPVRRLRTCSATWAAVSKDLAPWVLGRCHRHGIRTMVWTVDRHDQIDRFLRDPRVDVLVTNRPLLAIERRARLRPAP
jgi:glycerophosphoryl diester phosphodiesterase